MKTYTANKWKGRSLDNYKTMHANTAKKKNVYEEFMKSKTLTRARIILFGIKTKNPTHKIETTEIKKYGF